MTRVFVDANVFMRFFTRDDHGQHVVAARLLRAAAESDLTLVTGPPVFFEIAWTLRAAHKLSKTDTLDVLARIAQTAGIELTDAALVDDALVLAHASGQEFADAYIAVGAQHSKSDAIATFNTKHFEKLGVTLYPLT